ncbi:MAG: cupin domain-containing protein [Flavobacteriales bacterium]|nr:cupin domain-containing protein [Flavobacteriales bacterium]MEB2341910.1 cupin domain-containing protein [Flavobacteriia bacterium]
METTIARPTLKPLAKGQTFQTLQVTARAGAAMPTHHATSEAIVAVKKGEALISFKDASHTLKAGDFFIIPGNKEHTLQIKQDFEAVVVLTADGKIEF